MPLTALLFCIAPLLHTSSLRYLTHPSYHSRLRFLGPGVLSSPCPPSAPSALAFCGELCLSVCLSVWALLRLLSACALGSCEILCPNLLVSFFSRIAQQPSLVLVRIVSVLLL